MKAMFQRFLSLLKSLFLRLRVMVTLQIGRSKLTKTDNDVDEDDVGKGYTNER